MAGLNIVISAKDMASGAIHQVSSALDGVSKAAAAPGKALGGLVDGLGKVGLAGLGLKMGFEAASGAINTLVGDAMEAEKITAATNAVLASTKSVSGMTAESVADLATALSKVAPFEDDAIQGAENMLLTFTNIGKDIFPTATETVLNMSQALGQDLKASSIQLGKALNDPIAGISALTRVGVKFTDAQKDQIKALVAAGDTIGAQKIILKELETEFGGAARAAGTTFAGKLTILQTQLGNVKESIGNALLPVLSGLLDRAMPLIDAFGEWLPGALNGAISTLQNLGNLIGGMGLGQILEDLADPFADLVRNLQGGNLQGAVNSIISLLETIGEAIGPQLRAWAKAFLDWAKAMIPPVLAQLRDLGRQLFRWVQEQLPGWWDQLGLWTQQFIAWATAMIPPVLAELRKFADALLAWLVDESPNWIAAFTEWLVKAAVDIIPKLAQLLLALADWALNTAVPNIIIFAMKMGGAIVKGILDALVDLVPGLNKGIGEALRQIRVDIGPFHISADGFWIEPPETNWGNVNSMEAAGHQAAGTSYWRGGLTWVGEHGPELLNLPRGSAVYSNSQSMAMAASGGNTTIINVPVYGSVLTESNLIDAIHEGLLRKQRSNYSLGFS